MIELMAQATQYINDPRRKKNWIKAYLNIRMTNKQEIWQREEDDYINDPRRKKNWNMEIMASNLHSTPNPGPMPVEKFQKNEDFAPLNTKSKRILSA